MFAESHQLLCHPFRLFVQVLCFILMLGEGNASAAGRRTAFTFFFSLTASHLSFQMLRTGASATAVSFSRRGCQQGSVSLSGRSLGPGHLRMKKCVCVWTRNEGMSWIGMFLIGKQTSFVIREKAGGYDPHEHASSAILCSSWNQLHKTSFSVSLQSGIFSSLAQSNSAWIRSPTHFSNFSLLALWESTI